MSYQALYRKWRPTTFDDIVGQEHVTKTLENEIKNGRIAHAYLFCGSRGTGKTTTAKVFSKAVNCESPQNGNPCNQCKTCRGIADGSLMDVVEIDAASNNGVENIRTINSEVSYMPSGVTYKIYIIDEVHMLSVSAFNALLKTLEEPPSHVIFILATTESHKIPATILSRCQRFDFKRIGIEKMAGRLREVASHDQLQIDEEALSVLSKAADGSLRDALSMLDQCASYDNGRIDAAIARLVTGSVSTDRLMQMGDAIAAQDAGTLLRLANNAVQDGFDPIHLLESLMTHFRNLILCKSGEDLIDIARDELDVLKQQAERFTLQKCLSALDTLFSSYDTAKWSNNPRMVLEVTLIRIAHPKADESRAGLLERIERLEQALAGGMKATVSPDGLQQAPVLSGDKKITATVTNTAAQAAAPAETMDTAQDTFAAAPADRTETTEITMKPSAEQPTVEMTTKDTTAQANPTRQPQPKAQPDKHLAEAGRSDYGELPEATSKPTKPLGNISWEITGRWEEVIQEIVRSGSLFLGTALRKCEFRLNGDSLLLFGMMAMAATPENEAIIQKAVRDICGADVSVRFEDGAAPEISAKPCAPAAAQEPTKPEGAVNPENTDNAAYAGNADQVDNLDNADNAGNAADSYYGVGADDSAETLNMPDTLKQIAEKLAGKVQIEQN